MFCTDPESRIPTLCWDSPPLVSDAPPGSEDFSAEEEVYEIITDPADFSNVQEKLEEAGLEFLEAEVQMIPTTTVSLDEKGIEKMERLIENLEDLDDVSNIYHNWEE